MMQSSRIVMGCGLFLLTGSACHEPTAPPAQERVAQPDQPDEATTRSKNGERAVQPPRVTLATEQDDSWLVVERTRKGSEGGWATGSFDRGRNKLTIRTRDVQRFAIHIHRIPIDWSRVVILGIDGRNSELRKRNDAVLHVSRDQHGQWVIAEPGRLQHP